MDRRENQIKCKSHEKTPQSVMTSDRGVYYFRQNVEQSALSSMLNSMIFLAEDSQSVSFPSSETSFSMVITSLYNIC